MSDSTCVLLAEIVLPEGQEPSMGKLADLEMLVMTAGGRQRTEAQFHALLGRVGLRLTRIVPVPAWSASSRGSPSHRSDHTRFTAGART